MNKKKGSRCVESSSFNLSMYVRNHPHPLMRKLRSRHGPPGAPHPLPTRLQASCVNRDHLGRGFIFPNLPSGALLPWGCCLPGVGSRHGTAHVSEMHDAGHGCEATPLPWQPQPPSEKGGCRLTLWA